MRKTLVVLIMLFPGAFAQAECADAAGEAERLACLDAALKCTAIASSAERLGCFDAVFVRSSQTAAQQLQDDVPESEKIPEDPVPEVARIRPRPGSQTTEAPPEEFIQAAINDVTTNRNGITYLFLDNGQVWRETEKTRVRFEAGQTVRIEPGIFGSRNLTINGGKRIVKVRRVQ